jgi:uncharacterized protein (DUF608 family)
MIAMIDNLWLATGDDSVLREFYDSAKRATIHAMNIRPEYGDKQVVAMASSDVMRKIRPDFVRDQDWVELVPMDGLSAHAGGVRLAEVLLTKRMAQKMGDEDFVKQCDHWYEAGSKTLEEDLWAGTHYMLFNEYKSGNKSDLVMSIVLDGEWIARFHGLPGVFRPDRVRTTLDTVAKANADPVNWPYGSRTFSNPDGSVAKGDFALWGATGTYATGITSLSVVYLYDGQRDFGMDLIRRMVDYLVIHQGNTWDMPLMWDAKSGERIYGSDYAQLMQIWMIPAALANQDLAGPSKSGGLVSRMLDAANPK